MIIYLYVKRHKITGLKYFGKTIQNPWIYPGSGKYWNRHLKVHENNVETIEVWGFDDQILCCEFAQKYSKLHNIVESKDWANLIPETGTDGGFTTSREQQKKIWENSALREKHHNSIKRSWTEKRKVIASNNTSEQWKRQDKSLIAEKMVKTKKEKYPDGNPNVGVYVRTEEIKHKMKLAAKERDLIKIVCEQCSKESNRSNYARWHGSNCKTLR